MRIVIFPSEVHEVSTLVRRVSDKLQRMERGDSQVNLQLIQRDLENAMARLSELSGVVRGVWNDTICSEPSPQSIADASPVLSLAGIQLLDNQVFWVRVNEISFIGRSYDLVVGSESLGLRAKTPPEDVPKLIGAMDTILPKLINPLVPCGNYRLDEVYSDGKHFYLLSSVL